MIHPNIFKIGSIVKIQDNPDMKHLKNITFRVESIYGEKHTLRVISNDSFTIIYTKYNFRYLVARVKTSYKKNELVGATYNFLGRYLI